MQMVYKKNLGQGEDTLGPAEVSDVAFAKVWEPRGWEEAPASGDTPVARPRRAKKDDDA